LPVSVNVNSNMFQTSTELNKGVLCNGTTRGRRLFLSLSDVYRSTLYATIQILLILFKQDGTNLKRVYNDHVNTDMSYKDFCDLCRKCWQQKYGFLVIDKDSALTDGRYRKGFDRNDFVIP